MDNVCKIIASLPQNASRELVQSSLGKVFAQQEVLTKPQNNSEASPKYYDGGRSIRVTPLMVACDKSQIKCLQYFYDIILETFQSRGGKSQVVNLGDNIIGQPMDVSPDSNNQAIHYAAMSNCAEAGMVLAKIQGLYTNKNQHGQNDSHYHGPKNDMKKDNSTLFYNFIQILSQQNSHGDSAFMMASFQGKSSILEDWIQALLTLAQKEGLSVKECLGSLRQIANLTNESGDTCLSIAVGHAHVDVVNCLLQERELWVNVKQEGCVKQSMTNDSNITESIILVNQNDIKKTKDLMDKINSLSPVLMEENNDSNDKYVLSGEKRQILKQKIQNTRRCLVMLQVSIAKLAEKRSNELLEVVETDNVEMKELIMSEKKGMKKKPKKQVKGGVSNGRGSNKLVQEEEVKHLDRGSPIDSDILSKPAFKTLHNGTIVSIDHPSAIVQNCLGNNKVCTKDEESIESLMKERCLQSTNRSQNQSTTMTAESMLESLCLDVSMLLLSPQRMAMELSPSQLDIIETVLNEQLQAVAKARQIHERLMKNMKD